MADRLKHHGATDDRRKMLALAATVDDVINLGRGDPDLETPGYIMEAAKEGLDKHMTHYTAWAACRSCGGPWRRSSRRMGLLAIPIRIS